MLDSADAWRRGLGSFCLVVAVGMLIWGQAVLKPHLDGVAFLLYWFACFAFTIAAIVIALLDVRALRRRNRDEQRKLIQQTLEQVEHERKNRSTDDKK